MGELQNVLFGGLNALKQPNLLQITEALYADDCFLDTDAIVGRNGYRACLNGAIGSPGTPQHIGRFRPTATSARTVVVAGGTIYLCKDPSTESTSNGTVDLARDVNGSDAIAINAFGVNDIVSGVSLGFAYFLTSNNTSNQWYRLDSNYILSVITPLSAPGTLNAYAYDNGSPGSVTAPTAVSWIAFSSLTVPSGSNLWEITLVSNSTGGWGGMPSTWIGCAGSEGGITDPSPGAYVNYKLPAAVNATGDDWLAIAIAPHTSSGSTTYPVQIQVAQDNSGSPGVWQNAGQVYCPVSSPSPINAVLLDMRQMDPDTRAAIRWIQFLVPSTIAGGGRFMFYGYAFLPSQFVSPPPVNYYLDFEDTVTGITSPLSAALSVNAINTPVATYPNAYMYSGGSPSSTGGQNSIFQGSSGATGTNGISSVFNAVAGGAGMPTPQQIGEVIAITTTTPVFTAAELSDGVVARLWKDTPSGRRLVNTASVGSAQNVTIVDYGGVQVLANAGYEAGGPPPSPTCLAGYAGRLAAGVLQRLWISSFIPPSTTDSPNQIPILSLSWSGGVVTATVASTSALYDGGTVTITGATNTGYNGTFIVTGLPTPTTFTYAVSSNPGLGSTATGYFAPSSPLPAWPPIAIEEADGWAYDVAPSAEEQITALNGDGDALYVFTNEACYVLPDLDPGSVPSLVMRRGALGNHAACYAEDAIFWASYDGVYSASGLTRIKEVTQDIRNLYIDWLLPTGSVMIAYQTRKLMVMQSQGPGNGTRYLRFDFVTGRWTRGTLYDEWYGVVDFMGTITDGSPATTIEQLWGITNSGWVVRWQPNATEDNQGAGGLWTQPIPNWRFSTGFWLESYQYIVRGLLVDASAAVNVTVAKTVAAANSAQARTFALVPYANQDEVWQPCAGDFQGYKFRFEMDGANSVSVNRLLFEMAAIARK